MSVAELISLLNEKQINTWFDLGLFIDSVKEDAYNYSRSTSRKSQQASLRQPSVLQSSTFNGFKKKLGKSG